MLDELERYAKIFGVILVGIGILFIVLGVLIMLGSEPNPAFLIGGIFSFALGSFLVKISG